MRSELIIDNGMVNCPRQGDIDIERCFGCSELRDIRSERDFKVLVCRGTRNSLREQPAALNH
jgi:hypothetical protein